MMKKTLLLSLLISLMCAPASWRSKTAAQPRQYAAAQSQSSQSAVEHFTKDGLSFDYPMSWKLTDRSTEAAQHLILSREGSSVLVTVIAHRHAVANLQQFEAARDAITKPYVESMARSLGVQKIPSWDEAKCLDVGERMPIAQRFAMGFRLTGQSNGAPSTGEVYVLTLGRRLVNLVYVRNDKDDAEGSAAWSRVVETLNVEGPPSLPSSPNAKDLISGGDLNSKTVKKPPPRYPSAAKDAGQQGTVTVQIIVGEDGSVVSAVAVSGPPLLRDASEAAARSAKFAPTLICGHPVKVLGVITYNFILQGPFIRR
jgi:TonB family protein